MSGNSRKAPRKKIETEGFLYTVDGWPICECKTLDVSSGGAKIKLMVSEELPDAFLLSLSRDGKVRRHCELRWREGDIVGVRFAVK